MVRRAPARQLYRSDPATPWTPRGRFGAVLVE